MNAQFALAQMPGRVLEPHRGPAPAVSWTREASRTVYGKRRRLDPVAATASITLVACAFGSFLLIGGAPAHNVEHRLTLIELADLKPPPPPPPPPPAPAAERPPRAAPIDLMDAPPPVIAPPPSPVAMVVPDIAPAKAESDGPDTAPPPARAAGPANAGDLSATMISATPPRYPVESRRASEQGTVTLAVLLSADGTVIDVSIAKTSGFYRLDRAALGAVRHWRWSPTIRNGNPVMVRGMVTIPFVLRT
jgi:protein TonB